MPSRDPEFAGKVESVFQEAWDAADRAAVLEARCGSDAELRREVEKLLAASEEVERSAEWNQPAIVAEAARTAAAEESAEVDRYKLIELIGSGGMGAVYKAV